jgi:hypothetical protein
MLSKRWIVAAAVAVGAAVAIALVLGVTFWGQKSDRAAVSRYIKSVDSVQQQMRVPLDRLLTAYRGFSTSKTSPFTEAQMQAASGTLRTLELRLTAIAAPAAATKLRALMLRLVASEVAVAHELDQLTRFLPRFRAVIGASNIARARLAKALAIARPPTPHAVHGTTKQIAKAQAAFKAAATRAAAGQAAAVDTYSLELAHVLRRLHELDPPTVLAPTYRTQLQTLEATRAAAGALATELRKTNRSQVPVLSRRMSLAARIAGSIPSQHEQIAAIKAYNARIRAIGAAQAMVQVEVSRLQNSVP